MALLHFLRSNPEIVLAQTIQQVVSNAGDGNLRDGNVASEEFRGFLSQIPLDALFGYVHFWSADKQLRACCTVSKRYEGDYQPYWYAYHPKWDDFLGHPAD